MPPLHLVLLSFLACAASGPAGGDGASSDGGADGGVDGGGADGGVDGGGADGGVDGGGADGGVDGSGADDHIHTSSHTDWTGLSTGSQHACGLLADGDALCWGYDWDDRTVVPNDIARPIRQIACGGGTTCALDADGAIACWGELGLLTVTVPEGRFASIASGFDFACALDDAGEATCWGDDEHGQTEAPADRFVKLSAGRTHACGLRADGEVICWGGRDPQPGRPPHTGEVADYGQTDVPAGTWIDVAAGDYHTCLLDPDGRPTCFGNDRAGETDAPTGIVLAGIWAGGVHSCGLDAAGGVHCWGVDSAAWDYFQAEEPPGGFSTLDLASVYTCGLQPVDDGQALLCWGALDDLPVQVP